MSNRWVGTRARGTTVLLLACLAGAGVTATAEDAAGTPSSRKVVVGPQYRAKAFHRWLWGADYRDLYNTPVELPVLDLHTYAGGLTPTGRLGHGQTQVLALRGADGKQYTFRPLIKDPTNHLPVDLRETVARRVLIDQMSSGHPAGQVVVPGLLEPTGILHNTPQIVVMPDDPALGEFRQTFANAVGDIEEWGGNEGLRRDDGDRRRRGDVEAAAREPGRPHRLPRLPEVAARRPARLATGTAIAASSAGRRWRERSGGSRSPRTAIRPSYASKAS